MRSMTTQISRGFVVFTALALLLGLARAEPAIAASDQEELVAKSRFTIEGLLADPEELPIESYVNRAKGILIIPELIKGGFILGAEGGSGVLLVRGNDGSWSNPAFYTLLAGSIGLQIGGQVSEVVFTLMSDEAVKAMLEDEFKFGGDLSVSVAHKGAGIEASSSTAFDSDIYAFSKAVGLFAGGSFEGAKLITREEWNKGYYGEGATPRAIVIDRRFSNPQANALRSSIP